MHILFVHQNFPAQYKHLAPALSKLGHEVVALTLATNARCQGVRIIQHTLSRSSTQGIHPWALETEAKVIRGESCARAAIKLKSEGFQPDLIYAHPGWGEALFLRDIFPNAKQIHFLEFFYAAKGQDVDFDPEYSSASFLSNCQIQMKNANHLLNLNSMDRGISPTFWQRSTYPDIYQNQISVIHDGIDTQKIKPQPWAEYTFTTLDNKSITLSNDDQVITFVNRNLEPSRGYHSFMRALPEILKNHPLAHVLIIGGDGTSYAATPDKGSISYKEQFFNEVKSELDTKRIHFFGRVSYEVYLQVLYVSSVHVYLTYPFVLSWSMLEAMSAGCVVVASDTSPVTEVIKHKENGLLVDFFSKESLVESVGYVLDNDSDLLPLRQAARATVVTHYDLQTVCLPAQLKMMHEVCR